MPYTWKKNCSSTFQPLAYFFFPPVYIWLFKKLQWNLTNKGKQLFFTVNIVKKIKLYSTCKQNGTTKHLLNPRLATLKLPSSCLGICIFHWHCHFATIGHSVLYRLLILPPKHAQLRKWMQVLLFTGTMKMHEALKLSLDATYKWIMNDYYQKAWYVHLALFKYQVTRLVLFK